MKTTTGNLSVISPANYRISVIGVLEEGYSDRLGGLTILGTESDQGTGIGVTTLTGQLADQAALFGVLNALYNMRMPLLKVEYLSVEKTKGEKNEK
jgi:hypothetical protein